MASHAHWLAVVTRAVTDSAPPGDVAAARASARVRAKMARWSPPPPSSLSSDPALRPVDFGADPTGVADSTPAFAALTAALLARASNVTVLDNGIADLGGATVDLGGGAYSLSAPLVIPPFYGNCRVINGALRAGPGFPPGRYLIEVGAEGACGPHANAQASCNVDVGLAGLALDGGLVAAGGARLLYTMGAVFGPQNYVVNFTAAGLNVTGGHEVMVTQAWFGEFLYSDGRQQNATASVAVGVHVNGSDHVVSDAVVFAGRVGVWAAGSSTLLEGVHTWNLAQANGGVGILVTAPRVRVVDCCLDWTDLVVQDPTLSVVSGAYFICGARLVLAPGPGGGAVDGLWVTGPSFNNGYCPRSGNATVVVGAPPGGAGGGRFTSVRDASVTGALFEGPLVPRGVAVTRTLVATAPTAAWVVDFTDALVFPPADVPIASVTYALTLDDGQPLVAHAARRPVGGVVTIETAAPVTGAVTITVDQSARSL